MPQLQCQEDHILKLVVVTSQHIKEFEVESRIFCLMAQAQELEQFPVEGRLLQEGLAPEEGPNDSQGFEVVLDGITNVEDEYGQSDKYEDYVDPIGLAEETTDKPTKNPKPQPPPPSPPKRAAPSDPPPKAQTSDTEDYVSFELYDNDGDGGDEDSIGEETSTKDSEPKVPNETLNDEGGKVKQSGGGSDTQDQTGGDEDNKSGSDKISGKGVDGDAVVDSGRDEIGGSVDESGGSVDESGGSVDESGGSVGESGGSVGESGGSVGESGGSVDEKSNKDSGNASPSETADSNEGSSEIEDPVSNSSEETSEGEYEAGSTKEDKEQDGSDGSSTGDDKEADSSESDGKDESGAVGDQEGLNGAKGDGKTNSDDNLQGGKQALKQGGELKGNPRKDIKKSSNSQQGGGGTKENRGSRGPAGEEVPTNEGSEESGEPGGNTNSNKGITQVQNDSVSSDSPVSATPKKENDEDVIVLVEPESKTTPNTKEAQKLPEDDTVNVVPTKPKTSNAQEAASPTTNDSVKERKANFTETLTPTKPKVQNGCNSKSCYGIKLSDYRAIKQLSKAFGLKPIKNPCSYSWVVCSPCKSAKHLTCVQQLDMSNLTVVNSEQVTQVLNRFSQLQQVALPQSPQIKEQQVVINSTDTTTTSTPTTTEGQSIATPSKQNDEEQPAPLAPVEQLKNGSKIEVSKAINQSELSDKTKADLRKFREQVKEQAENNEVPPNTTISVVGVSSENGSTVITTITQNLDQDKVNSFTDTLRQASESGNDDTPLDVAAPDATEIPNEAPDLPSNTINVTVQVLNDSIARLSRADLSDYYTNDRIGQTVPDLRYQCNEFRNKMRENDELSRDRYLTSSNHDECDNLELVMSASSVLQLLVKTSKPVDKVPYGEQETAFGLERITVLNVSALDRTTLEPTSEAETTHWSVFIHINIDHQIAFLQVEQSTLTSSTIPSQTNILSNVLALLLDNHAPTPAIDTLDQYDFTFQNLPVFTVYFWESLLLREGRNMSELVTLRGGKQGKGMPYWIVDGEKPLHGSSGGALQDGIVTVTVGLKDVTKKYDILLSVNPGILTDYAGNLNKQANMTLRYRPPDQTLKGFSAAAGATVALSTGAAVGASMGIPGTAAIGGVSGLFMIWQTQKFVMKKNMAVPNLPHMYRYASDQLRWLSLDIPLPWQGNGPIKTVQHPESSRAGRTLAQVVTDDAESSVQIPYIPQSKKELAFDHYKRTMFWAFLILAGVSIIHLTILTVFSAIRKHPPDVLLLPRGEILVALLLTLPVISASIRMLFGSSASLALGVVSLFIAVCFIVFAFTLIWYNLYHLPISKRRAHFIVEDHRQRVMHSYKHSKVDHSNASSTDKQFYHDSQFYSPTQIDSSVNSSDTAARSPFMSDTLASDSAVPNVPCDPQKQSPVAESIEPGPISESTTSNGHSSAGYRFSRSDSAYSGNLRNVSRGVRALLRSRSMARYRQRQRLVLGSLSPSISSAADSRTKFSVLGRSQQNSYGMQSDERKTWVETIKVPVYSFFGSQGDWIPGRHRDSKFVAKYGSLFEDTRGQPLIREGATYDFDPVTGRVNRGRLVPLEEPALFHFLGRPVHASSITAYALVIEAVKLGMLAVLLEAVDSVQSYAQVSGLMVITIAHLIYVRVCKPFASPRDVMIVLIGDCADLGTFVCGILLLSSSRENETFQHRVGVAMIVMEFVALAAYILERISRLWRMCARVLYPSIARRFGRDTPSQQFADVVYQVMARDPDILARKFGDRWLTKGLGRGLQHRLLRRKEQPIRQVLSNGMRKSLSRTASGISLLLPGGPSGSLSDHTSLNGDHNNSMSFGTKRESSQGGSGDAWRQQGQLPPPYTANEDNYGLFDIESVTTTPVSQSSSATQTNRAYGEAKQQNPGSTMLDIWSKISSPRWDSVAQNAFQTDQLEQPSCGHVPDQSGTTSLSDMYSHTSSTHGDDKNTQTDIVLESEDSVESQLSFSNMLQCASGKRSSRRSSDGQGISSAARQSHTKPLAQGSTEASSSRSSPTEHHTSQVYVTTDSKASIKGKGVGISNYDYQQRTTKHDPLSRQTAIEQSPAQPSHSPPAPDHPATVPRPASAEPSLLPSGTRGQSPTLSSNSNKSSQQGTSSSASTQADDECIVINPQDLLAQLSPTRRNKEQHEEPRRPGSPPPEWANITLRPRSETPPALPSSTDIVRPSKVKRGSLELPRSAVVRAQRPETVSAPVSKEAASVLEQQTVHLAANSLLNHDSARSDGPKVPKIKPDYKAQRVGRTRGPGNFTMVTPRKDSESSMASSTQSDVIAKRKGLWDRTKLLKGVTNGRRG